MLFRSHGLWLHGTGLVTREVNTVPVGEPVQKHLRFVPLQISADTGLTGLTGENRVFRPVKKKPGKHTTKKEKSQKNVIATAFSLSTFSVSPSCTVLVLQPSSHPYFFFVSSDLHVFLVGVLKIWLESMPSLFPSSFLR